MLENPSFTVSNNLTSVFHKVRNASLGFNTSDNLHAEESEVSMTTNTMATSIVLELVSIESAGRNSVISLMYEIKICEADRNKLGGNGTANYTLGHGLTLLCTWKIGELTKHCKFSFKIYFIIFRFLPQWDMQWNLVNPDKFW